MIFNSLVTPFASMLVSTLLEKVNDCMSGESSYKVTKQSPGCLIKWSQMIYIDLAFFHHLNWILLEGVTCTFV